MAKNTSRYALKLARRNAAGPVRINLPVDKHDLVTARGERFPMPTLNPERFSYDNGVLKTRTFERRTRADEL
jgi:hypothetical protein